jgi:hypothetical protein
MSNSDDDANDISRDTLDKEQIKDLFSPKDTYNVCWVIFFLFGIGALLPWNAVLSTMPFFEEKV